MATASTRISLLTPQFGITRGVARHFDNTFAAACPENQGVNPASFFRRELHRSGLPASWLCRVGVPWPQQHPWPRHPQEEGDAFGAAAGLLTRVSQVPHWVGGATQLLSLLCWSWWGLFSFPGKAACGELRAPRGGRVSPGKGPVPLPCRCC